MDNEMINKIAVILLIIGGLNYFAMAFFTDLFDVALGGIPWLVTIVYVLVGIAAVYKIFNFNN